MNAYPRLSQLKQTLNTSLKVVPGTEGEPRMLEILEQVSREFDGDTRNPMFVQRMTVYPDFISGACGLWLRPFVSLSEVAIDERGSGEFTIELVANTDYVAWADPSVPNGPYLRIDRLPNSTAFYGWPYVSRRTRVTGLFGYSYETRATGAAIGNTGGINESATLIEVAKGHGIDIGETLVLEKGTGNEEQVSVVGRPDVQTIEVERGINGTTASAHAKDVPLLRRVYPADVVNGCIERARYLWHNEFRGGQEPDSLGFATSSWPRWRRLTGKYEIPGSL